tara:strand:+ start:1627 stop:1866 length:240 start_codon:yes stop_codon:yes gene_type:complete
MGENDNDPNKEQDTGSTSLPTSDVSDAPSGPVLAGRGMRFGAYVVDCVISTIVFLVIVGLRWWITFDDLAQFGTQPSTT